MEISKPPKSFILEWLSRIHGLPFHFHVLNLFKYWSNLGFDQDSNGHKNSEENQKNEKPKHIVFLCHIVSIEVDKQGLDIIKQEKACIYPLTLNFVLWSQARREVVLGFKHGKKNLPEASFWSD